MNQRAITFGVYLIVLLLSLILGVETARAIGERMRLQEERAYRLQLLYQEKKPGIFFVIPVLPRPPAEEDQDTNPFRPPQGDLDANPFKISL